MCKTIIHLTLFVFVLGLIPAGTVQAADPSLQFWLEFEDNANDSSNFARPTFQEDAAIYIDGPVGRASDLNGNDYIAATNWKGVTGTSAFTIALWINSGDGSGTIVGWGTGRGNNGEDIQFRTANSGTLRIGNGDGNIRMTTKVNDNEWHHIAVTVTENGTMSLTDVILYLDGFDDTNPGAGSINGSTFNIPPTGYDVRVGKEYDDPIGTSERRWNGDIDDLRIYDRELSASEIRELAGAAGPLLTVPDDDAVLVQANVTLEWLAGVYAADVDGHEVFLSEVFEDVNSGAPAASQGLTSNAWYFTLLDNAKTYYWKIDAVNDLHATGRWSSDIRSFFVPPVKAYDPSPADTAAFVDPSATLSWSPGMAAILQHVFFGESLADVTAGTGGTDKGQQPGTGYTPALASDTTYYFRIDTITTTGTVTGDVWSFTTEPDMPLTGDPNLVGYWKLDINEPSATVAVDHSGYDNHGSLRGDAQFVAGFEGEAIQLDGDGDYVNIDGYKGVTGGKAFTAVAWINTTSMAQENTVISWGSTGSGNHFSFRPQTNNVTPGSMRTSQGNANVQGTVVVNDGEWHHVAVTVIANAIGSSSDVRIYTDGQDVTRESTDLDPLNIAAGADLTIGMRAYDTTRPYEGLIDEVRLYDRVLSEVEIARLMDPSKAVNPKPVNRARDVERTPTLTWTPGIDESTGTEYTKHNVYFSDSFEDVNSGAVAPVVVEGSNQYSPGLLPYYDYQYWRVDGVNAADEANRGFIWNFKVTFDPTQIVDPNLLAWYKLDGDGTDSSGYGRDLTMNGEPGYVDAVQDQGMAADGVDDYGVYEFFPTEEWMEFTITAWAKLDGLNAANNESVFSSFGASTDGFQIDVNGTSDTYRFNGENEQATFGPESDGWVHLAVAYDGLRATLFYNGRFVTTLFTTEGTFNQFAVGANRTRGTLFGGIIDDVRIYDRELTDPEIIEIMRGNLALAWNPNPADGASGVDLASDLSWSPGDYETGHNVYFGADDPANMVLQPSQPQAPNDFDPGDLDLGTTYYWQIGEVNGAGMDLGRIWSFTTTDHFDVEDYESYLPAGTGGEMWQTWIDGMGDCAGSGNGTGANLTADPGGRNGSQGMRYDYDHDGSVANPCSPGSPGPRSLYYSKASVAIASLASGIGSDWSGAGIKALSLYFYGDVNNVLEPMWVQLSDGTPGAKVFYGTYEGEDAADMTEESWHEWFIDLADCGVNLANVVSISIGIGTEGAAVHDASGTLFFDDITLHASRCVPGRAKPPADFDNSCNVGPGDLRQLFEDWALSGFDFTVAAPGGDSLDAHYEFEDNLLDSAGAHHADPSGAVSYAAGTVGTLALSLDGTNHAIATGYKGILGTQDRTTAAWIKTTGSDSDTMMIVNWGTQTDQGGRWAMRINLPGQDGADGGIRADFDGGNLVGTTDLRDGAWHHVAAVLESNGMPRAKNIAIYVDGRREALTNRTGRDIDINTVSDNDVTIGAAYFSADHQFVGSIDDLRIYGRALSNGEIAGLAGLTVATELTEPLRSILTSPEDTDLTSDGKINFFDYVDLLGAWNEEILWP